MLALGFEEGVFDAVTGFYSSKLQQTKKKISCCSDYLTNSWASSHPSPARGANAARSKDSHMAEAKWAAAGQLRGRRVGRDCNGGVAGREGGVDVLEFLGGGGERDYA